MAVNEKKYIKEKFNIIKNNKFLWPQTLKERNQKKPLLSRFFILWAWFQTILIHRLKIKKPFIKIETFWGDKMIMILPHPTFLYFYGILGRNEIFLTDFIINHLKNGDVFIDGGANIGYYTLLASRIVGDKGQVHSFEPTLNIYQILEDNSRKNKNVHLYMAALLDKNGTVNFTDFGLKHSLYNSIIELPVEHIANQESKSIKTISVESITLDDYCDQYNLKPNFIKLDTEGAELNVVLGAKRIITKYKPIIAIEVWEYAIEKGDFKRIYEFFSKYSYFCYQLAGNFKLIQISSSKGDFDRRFYNIVFIPKESTISL